MSPLAFSQVCHHWDRFGIQAFNDGLGANNDAHEPPGSDVGDGKGIRRLHGGEFRLL
jgi:hypothetical protein